MKKIVLIFVLITKLLVAQKYEYYSYENTKDIISASADNYFPKLNEPVKLTVKFIIPQPGILYNFGFSFLFPEKSGVEIIDGKKRMDISGEKGDTVKLEMTIKFTKKKFYRIDADISPSTFVRLHFYVEGVAYFDSDEVHKLKSILSQMEKRISSYREKGELKHPMGTMLGSFEEINKKQEQTIIALTEYEKTDGAIKKAQEWNAKLFEPLKNKYDSLKSIIEEINFNHFGRIPASRKRGARRTKTSINKIKTRKIANGVAKIQSESDLIYAIKDHKSVIEYEADKAISSISLIPTNIGEVYLYEDQLIWFYLF